MVRSGDARSGSAPFSRNSAGFAVVLAVSRQLDNFVRRNNVAGFHKTIAALQQDFRDQQAGKPQGGPW
jgi:hypothetical protein